MSEPKFDLVQRGSRRPSPVGTSTFVLLRSLVPFLQLYLLLTSPLTTLLLPKFGIHLPAPPFNDYSTFSTSSSSSVFTWPLTTTSLSHSLNLDPSLSLSAPQTILFLMSSLAALKQINWIIFVSKEEMSVVPAIIIVISNGIFDSANILAFSLARFNPTYPSLSSSSSSWPLALHLGISSLVFASGLLVEAVSEAQRLAFKDEPRNEGKLFMGGLFGLARSVNYGAYVVWRTGFALAGGGPVWAVLVAAFFTHNFATRGLPIMEEYCEKRYGARQWEEFKRKVPYRLIPGVY